MKQKKETLAFECSLHQAHLLRRYARSIGLDEADIDQIVTRHLARNPLLGQYNHENWLRQQQLARAQSQQFGRLEALAGSLRGLF